MAVRLCGVALVALLLVTGAVAQTGGLHDYARGFQTISTADDAVLADLSKYYRIHAMYDWGVNSGWPMEWLGAC
jgi:hypothetical protein